MKTDKQAEPEVGKPKITVFGGTSFDAAKGANMLQLYGLDATATAISTSPEHQVNLYQNPDKLVAVYKTKLEESASDYQLLYCNSLSFALYLHNYHKPSTWELTKYYKKILKEAELTQMAIMVSDEVTAENLRRFVVKERIGLPTDLQIFPDIELIKKLEKSSPSTQIELIDKELEKFKKAGFTQVLFGCTHLDNTDFNNYQGLTIFQPGFMMMQEFTKTCKTLPF